jgi:hypothetical protein
MKYMFFAALCCIGCELGQPGPLEIDVLWETSRPGLYSGCDHVDLDIVDYIVLDYRSDIVKSSGGATYCRDHIYTYVSPGGQHELDIQGYFYDRGELVLGWDALCSGLFVDGDRTPAYECRVRRVGYESE